MTEKVERNLKRTRNTPRYWIKMTKEAGWDQISLEHQIKDRTQEHGKRKNKTYRRLGNEPRKWRKKSNEPNTTNAVRKR